MIWKPPGKKTSGQKLLRSEEVIQELGQKNSCDAKETKYGPLICVPMFSPLGDGILWIITSDWSVSAAKEGDNAHATIMRTNQVAPIIIKNCNEEFQHVSDFKDPIVYGSLVEGSPGHPLVQVRTDRADRVQTGKVASQQPLIYRRSRVTIVWVISVRCL